MAFWYVAAFTVYTAATIVLSEYWRSKRPRRHHIKPGDAAKLARWLHAKVEA